MRLAQRDRFLDGLTPLADCLERDGAWVAAELNARKVPTARG